MRIPSFLEEGKARQQFQLQWEIDVKLERINLYLV